jgi:hypothetical protein
MRPGHGQAPAWKGGETMRSASADYVDVLIRSEEGWLPAEEAEATGLEPATSGMTGSGDSPAGQFGCLKRNGGG